MQYARTVNFSVYVDFVNVNMADYGIIYVTLSTTPYKTIDVLINSFIL